MPKKILYPIFLLILLLTLFGYNGSEEKNKDSGSEEKIYISKEIEGGKEVEEDSQLQILKEKLDEVSKNPWVELVSVDEDKNIYSYKVESMEEIEPPKVDLSREIINQGKDQRIEYKDSLGNTVLTLNITRYTAPKVAIIIDDVGMTTKFVENFKKIDKPLTFAIIPFLPKSRETSKELEELGYERILHMPMAGSNDYLNERTKGILVPNMTKYEIYKKFDEALEDVGSVDGFNNHMGSRFTQSQKGMSDILKYAKRKGIFYIDSKTIASSVGYEVARDIKIPSYYSSHFIDNKKEIEYIKEQIDILIKDAKTREYTVAIGHYNPVTAKGIYEKRDEFAKNGIRLVSARDIIKAKGENGW